MIRDVVVAIDLETTGLDPTAAQIIEIGAVKFQGDTILDTFQSLVDPVTSIPARITSITGIRQEDLIGAPKLPDVLPRLTAFIADAVLLGQNVEFDLGFLNREGVAKGHRIMDTYDLASVLLPTTPRYNLNALMQALQLQPEGDYHRALADSMATARVYMALWQRLLNEVPLPFIQEVVSITQNLPWHGLLPFQEALAIRNASGISITLPSTADLFASDPTRADESVLPSVEDTVPVAVETTAESQEVAAAVHSALVESRHLLLEVDPQVERLATSLDTFSQYLAGEQSQKRLLVATTAGELDSVAVPMPFVQLHSREYYLCPARLNVLRQRLPTSVDEVRVLAKILYGLYTLGSAAGRRKTISLRGPAEYGAWARLSAQDENCTIERCQLEMHGICPFLHARQRAEHVQVVVVDHGLIIADAEAGSPVLPAYSHALIDNAHALEEAVGYSLRWRVDASSIKFRLADMGTGRRGLLGSVISSLRQSLSPAVFERLNSYIASVASTIAKMEHHVDSLFKAIYTFLESNNQLSNTEFVVYIRLTSPLREKSGFGPVRESFSILAEFIDGITAALETLANQLATLRSKQNVPDLEQLISGTGAAARYLLKLRGDIEACLTTPRVNTIYWIEFSRDNFRLSLHAAPLQIGGLLQQHLWNSKESVLLLDSAVRVGGSFQYIQNRLGIAADQITAQAITRRHDHRQSTAIFLPTDMPEPSERDRYQRALERAIIELATVTNGRLLGLFTSFTQLRQSSQTIAARLALGDITVFDQSDGSSERALIENFRAAQRGVLLGGRSLWEGAAFTADELAALVVTRLPFAVPSDPLVASRSETFEDSFNDYMVPEAILRFRQAFNRLSYVPHQRNMLLVLDRRMTSKDYGRLFLDSLPPCTVIKAPLADLIPEAKTWFEPHL